MLTKEGSFNHNGSAVLNHNGSAVLENMIFSKMVYLILNPFKRARILHLKKRNKTPDILSQVRICPSVLKMKTL